MIFTTWPCTRQFFNYSIGETSWERFARKSKNKDARIYSAEYDSDDSDGVVETDGEDENDDAELLGVSSKKKKRGFGANCREMCCRKKVVS